MPAPPSARRLTVVLSACGVAAGGVDGRAPDPAGASGLGSARTAGTSSEGREPTPAGIGAGCGSTTAASTAGSGAAAPSVAVVSGAGLIGVGGSGSADAGAAGRSEGSSPDGSAISFPASPVSKMAAGAAAGAACTTAGIQTATGIAEPASWVVPSPVGSSCPPSNAGASEINPGSSAPCRVRAAGRAGLDAVGTPPKVALAPWLTSAPSATKSTGPCGWTAPSGPGARVAERPSLAPSASTATARRAGSTLPAARSGASPSGTSEGPETVTGGASGRARPAVSTCRNASSIAAMDASAAFAGAATRLNGADGTAASTDIAGADSSLPHRNARASARGLDFRAISAQLNRRAPSARGGFYPAPGRSCRSRRV